MDLNIIDIDWINHHLEEAFPTVEIKQGCSINAAVASVTIWEFHLHCTVTAHKVSHADTEGECLMVFWQKTEDRRPIERFRKITTDKNDVAEFIQYARAWIMGVLHVLHESMLGEKPLKVLDVKEGADLFKGDDW